MVTLGRGEGGEGGDSRVVNQALIAAQTLSQCQHLQQHTAMSSGGGANQRPP